MSEPDLTLWSKRSYDSYDVIIAGSATGDLSDCTDEVRSLVAQASSIMASSRLVSQLSPSDAIGYDRAIIHFPRDLHQVWDLIDELPRIRVVLATGDPGFFGIVRLLREQRPHAAILTLPSASSVSRAFGRIGRSWDDATVLSAHGRSQGEIAAAMRGLRSLQECEESGSFAVLTSPDHPPERVVTDLTEAQVHVDRLIVASDLDTEKESVIETNPETVIANHYSPLSIVIGIWGAHQPRRAITSVMEPLLITNRSAFNDTEFVLPDTNYTKPHVRSAIVGRLKLDTLPYGAEVCDLGAGYGTVGTTLLALRSDLNLTFVERDQEKSHVIEENLARFHRHATVITTDIVSYLKNRTHPPDALFLGGGGAEALRSVVELATTQTRICATFASIERAQLAHELLGNVEIISERRLRHFNGGSRITESHSTFVAWNYL